MQNFFRFMAVFFGLAAVLYATVYGLDYLLIHPMPTWAASELMMRGTSLVVLSHGALSVLFGWVATKTPNRSIGFKKRTVNPPETEDSVPGPAPSQASAGKSWH